MSDEIKAFIGAGQAMTYRGTQQITSMSPSDSRAFLRDLARADSGLKMTCVKVSTSGADAKVSFDFVEDGETGVGGGDESDVHVYSVQKQNSTAHMGVALSNDLDRFISMMSNSDLASSEGRQALVDFCGPVKFDGLGVSTRPARSVSAAPVPANKASSAKSAFKSATSSSSSSSSSSSKSSKKNQAQVAAFFGKATPKSAEKKCTTQAEPQDVDGNGKPTLPVHPPEEMFAANAKVSSKSSDEKENTAMEINSDDEWDDGTKVDKNKLKDRQPAFNEPKGTGGASESDVMAAMISEADGAADTAAADSGGADQVGVFKVHGAMDDFVDDERIRREQSGQASVKKRRKKQVEKMEVDAKGYMVTTYEEVWVTDDEPSPVRKPKPVAKPALQKPTPKPTAKGKNKGSAGMKTMASFFGKK